MTVAIETNVNGLLMAMVFAQSIIILCYFAVMLVKFAVYTASITIPGSSSSSFSVTTSTTIFQTTSEVTIGSCSTKTTVQLDTFAEAQGWANGAHTVQGLLLVGFFIMCINLMLTISLFRVTDARYFIRKLQGTMALKILGWILLWCIIDPYDYADNMAGFCVSSTTPFSSCSNTAAETDFNALITALSGQSGSGSCYDLAGYVYANGSTNYYTVSDLFWVSWVAYILIILASTSIRRSVMFSDAYRNANNVTVITTNGGGASTISEPIYSNNNTTVVTVQAQGQPYAQQQQQQTQAYGQPYVQQGQPYVQQGQPSAYGQQQGNGQTYQQF